MLKQKRILILGAASVTVAAAIAASTLGTGQPRQRGVPGRQSAEQQRERFESQFPIVDYMEAEPSDPEKLEKRRAKGAKYDKSPVTVELDAEVATTSPHWANGLPAFPVSQSAVIAVGTVTQAQAHMSNNRKGVYSEFTFRVEELIKQEYGKSLAPNTSITVDRVGGRVRLPSGRVGTYWVTGQGMPRPGRRYVLFLGREEGSPDFSIITGYELDGEGLQPLDRPGGGHPFSRYEGADEQTFMTELRAATNPQRPY